MFQNKIHFGNEYPSFLSYQDLTWNLMEQYNIEFFPNEFYKVTLISTETPDLYDYLNGIVDGNKIAIDLEWENELCLFQFCTSKGVLVVRHPNGPGNRILLEFLQHNKFFGKGMHNDFMHLTEKFNVDFKEEMEDIAMTRLIPYHYSENFMEMTLQFAGEPTDCFKNVVITKSNWEAKELSITQVIYAAFDVVAIFKAYPNFPPQKKYEKIIKIPKLRLKQEIKIPIVIKKKSMDIVKTMNKIVLKTVPIKKIYPFIRIGYKGTLIPTQIRKIFDQDDVIF